MKIENLKSGMVAKNYKELCSMLEIKPTGGDSKKSQLKELERFIKYHKEGNKFIVDEIYSEPTYKIDNRSMGNNSVYGEDLRNLILHILATSDELGDFADKKYLTIPCTLLLRKLHMINCNYALGRREQAILSELMCMEDYYVNDFYNTTHENLKTSLESSLNQLYNMRLIEWKKEKMVCKKKAIYKMNEVNEIMIDDDFKPVYEITESYQEATVEEASYILRVENNLLKEYECEYISEVFKKGKISEFYTKANKLVKENTNIMYYFSGYKIIFNKDIVEEKLLDLGIDVFEVRKTINKKVKEKTLNNAIKRNGKALEEYYKSDILPNKNTKRARLKDNYLTNMDLLITILIDIGANDICSEIKKMTI